MTGPNVDRLLWVDNPEGVVTQVLTAWRVWKMGHDRTTAEITCCGRSRDLFAALDAFEEACAPAKQQK